VLGIGFAATRDLVSFLRHAKADDAGTPNPLAGQVRWSVVSGTSQSGNFVKSFINLGFNRDESGARVFDGANPNIAARQVPLNLRFAVPGGAATLFEPGSEGTLWWTRYNDTTRGRGAHSLLDRCTATGTCPRIMETFGSTELWGLRLSPALVGTDAKADVPIAANVRRYYFPGVTHGGSITGGISRWRQAMARRAGLRAGQQSKPFAAHDARLAEAAGRVGQHGPGAAAKPVSHAGGGRSGGAHRRRDALAQHPRCARARWQDQRPAGLRLRPRLRLSRPLGRDHPAAAQNPPRDTLAGAACRCGWQ
jgi:hypothetical protein